MKGLFIALKCFMLEFWDLQQYAPTWNTTTLDYLDKLPRNAEAKCIHLPESTRICQLKVLPFYLIRGYLVPKDILLKNALVTSVPEGNECT